MIKAQFLLSGEAKHSKTLGAENEVRPEVFVEEISGQSFTLTAPGLEPGTYSIEIELVESVLDGVGRRVFDIHCGSLQIAKDLDILKAAGGFRKTHLVRGQIEHLGDAQRGPIAIAFTGTKQEAKFNAVSIRDKNDHYVARVLASELSNAIDPESRIIPKIADAPIYSDRNYPLKDRIDDLIRRMSLKEKIDQLVNAAGQIERLDIPGYDYWNECLHGVARNGIATCFPQAIALGAMWDDDLIYRVADVISTEARAKFNALGKVQQYHRYQGLTMWSPTINIFRDPRWGRGQESYGEDPFLTARLGVAFIRGLQGEHPEYLKVAACAKHYAAHSGPEPGRRSFDVSPSERDLYETYLPHFKAAVCEAKVEAVMGAYNSLYEEPCNTNAFLLTELLRERWGFDGHVVADCGAIRSIYADHRLVETAEEAVAKAIKAGCDLDCGVTFGSLLSAYRQGLVSSEEIDQALHRLLRTRFRLGMFDEDESQNPWTKIPASTNDTAEHQALALEATRASIVLLKNNGLLPLKKSSLKRVAIIGANADSVPALLGNYHGDPSAPITFLSGLQEELGHEVEIDYTIGCPLALPKDSPDIETTSFDKAVKAAELADVLIYFGGISSELEGEEMPAKMVGFNGGDRTGIELPAIQTELLKALHATGCPIVFVNCSGSAIAFPWEAENLPAIVQAWYPGQTGGKAVADILFGRKAPSGKLPVTFYQSTDELPDYFDYSMENRTYRYYSGEPLFPFGHGLSYTNFEYGSPRSNASVYKISEIVEIDFDLTNTGACDGDEIVQLYVRQIEPDLPKPTHSLAAFKRVSTIQAESLTVTLTFPITALSHWDEKTQSYEVSPGEYEIQIGSSSKDIRQTLKIEIINPPDTDSVTTPCTNAFQGN